MGAGEPAVRKSPCRGRLHLATRGFALAQARLLHFTIPMSTTTNKRVEWILRIALFGEFLGHGIFAYRVAPNFVPLVTGSLGVTEQTAATLLPIFGVIDFVIAAVALIRPIPIVILYAAIWGFLTGLARPFSGVTVVWDFVERWPNWGVPLALLYVRGVPRKWSEWVR